MTTPRWNFPDIERAELEPLAQQWCDRQLAAKGLKRTKWINPEALMVDYLRETYSTASRVGTMVAYTQVNVAIGEQFPWLAGGVAEANDRPQRIQRIGQRRDERRGRGKG